ncbi:MAG: hypothetical protein ACFFFG_07815 [Candidatus Thorarchaeota archaeon]
MEASPEAIMRKFGLEFIKDNAKDRKIAIQTLGVTFKNAIQTLGKSSVMAKARVEDREYIVDLFEELHNEANRTIETQLTRLTVKAFNWIKNILVSSEKLAIGEERSSEALVDELQEKVGNLEQQSKIQSDELSRIRNIHEATVGQVIEKDSLIQRLEQKLTSVKTDLQQQLTIEKTRGESLSKQVEAMDQKIKRQSVELSEKDLQNRKFQDEVNELSMQLVVHKTEINRLQQSLEQKNKTIDQINISTDRTAAEAMAAWADSYQKQEITFQNQLAAARHEYEGTMQQKLEETANRFEAQIAALKRQVRLAESQTIDQSDEYTSKISELSAKLRQIEERNKELDNSITELIEKNGRLEKDLGEQRTRNDELLRDIEATKNAGPAISLTDIQKTSSKLKNMNEYIDQVLQLSNFSMITILLRMNGKMSLDHLAKSVGMDPLVLENQLQPLHQRNLIDIQSDGQIIANIPKKT